MLVLQVLGIEDQQINVNYVILIASNVMLKPIRIVFIVLKVIMDGIKRLFNIFVKHIVK
jgi:hypothetical protein